LTGCEQHVERDDWLRQTFEGQGPDIFEGKVLAEASRNAPAPELGHPWPRRTNAQQHLQTMPIAV
jgi:hypothetical protein